MSVIDLLAQIGRMAAAVPMAVAAEVLAEGEGESADGWWELRNRSRAFERFWSAPPLVAAGRLVSAQELAPELARRLREADALTEADGPWNALWLREGLGFRWAEALWNGGHGEEEMASAVETLAASGFGWRSGWSLPLHTGAGLCLAMHTLAPLVLEGVEAAVAEPVERFHALCRGASRAGCELATFEALGLVAWVLYPGRVGAIDGVLRSWTAERGPAWREGFWHGVGRGLYFTPIGSMPWRRPGVWGLRTARAEAPDATARRNAVAGLGWALALVNVRQPELAAGVLPEVETSPEDEAVLIEGIARAAVVWADGLAPQAGSEGSDRLEAFLECRGRGPGDGASGRRASTPATEGGETPRPEELWRARVAPECRRALETWLPGGRLPERFGDLFRCGTERETTTS